MAEAKIKLSVDGAAQVVLDLNSVEAKMLDLEKRLNQSNEATKKAGITTAQYTAAMRMVPAQITDIVVSLASGQQPLTVLLQQGGQLKDMFGGVGTALKGVAQYVIGMINPYTLAAAAAAGLSAAWYQGQKEADEFRKTLIMSGNVVGTTADKMINMSAQIRASGVATQGAAAAALNILASSGKVGEATLQQFTSTALRMEQLVGKSVDSTAQDLSQLSKNPLDAAVKLNEQYGYLTASVYKQIKALEDQGKTAEAAKLAQETYMTSLNAKMDDVQNTLGLLEKSWNAIKKGAKGAWDAMLDIGREQSLEQKIADLESKVRRGQTMRTGKNGEVLNLSEFGAYDENTRQLDSLKEQLRLRNRSAAAAEEQSKLDQAGVKWLSEGNQFLTKRQQMEKEIAQTRSLAKAAGYKVQENGVGEDSPEVASRLAAISRKYADLNNSRIVLLENARSLEKEVMSGQLADLENQHKALLVSDADYLLRKRDLQMKDIDAEITLAREQAAIAGGREDMSERMRYLGQIAVLEQKKRNLMQETASAMDLSNAAVLKMVTDQAASWNAATASEIAALETERLALGATAEERKIHAEQMKVEAELIKLVSKAREDGKVLMPDEIALLRMQAEQRKANIATLEGERSAREGARQLYEENAKFGAEMILDEQERARFLLEIDAKKWRDRIALAQEGSEAQKQLQEQYDIWYRNQSIKPQLDAQKEMWRSIDGAAHDAFVNIFNGGRNAFDRLKDTLKAGLLDLLYQMTIKKWIVSIGASVTGSVIPGMVAGSSGFTFGNMFSAGKALFEGFNTAGGGFLASLAGGLGGSSFGPGFNSEMGVNIGNRIAEIVGPRIASSMASGVQMLASIAPYAQAAGALYMANQLGKMISGGMSIGKVGGNALVNAGTLLFGIPGAIGAGLLNRAFGMGDKQITGSSITGTLGTDNLYRNVNWYQQGGWLRSDRSGTWSYGLNNSTAVADGKSYVDSANLEADKALLKYLTESYASLKTASADYAKALGIDASSISARTDQINVAIGKDAAETQANIQKMFSGISDSIAAGLLGALTSLSQSGETASAALARLASEVKAVDEVTKALGLTQIIAGNNNELITFKDRLVQMAGGLEAFSQSASFFAENFLTDAEKVKPAQDQVADVFRQFGITNVTTTEQFKQLVQGLDLSTEAGAKEYAALMKLAPAFKQVTDYTNKTAEAAQKQTDAQKQSLQSSIDSLTSFSKKISQYRDSLMLANGSPLTPEQQYQAAKAQYQKTLAAARAGDKDAQGNFTEAANAFLNASRMYNASGGAYIADFNAVQLATEDTQRWLAEQIDVQQASLKALDQNVEATKSVEKAIRDLDSWGIRPPHGRISDSDVAAGMAMDYSGYGASNTQALVAELKQQRSLNEKMLAELKQLREDNQRQSDNQIAANYDASAKTAEQIAQGSIAAVKEQSWVQQSAGVLR